MKICRTGCVFSIGLAVVLLWPGVGAGAEVVNAAAPSTNAPAGEAVLPGLSTGKDVQDSAAPATKVSESTPGPQKTVFEGAGAPPKVGVTEETVVGQTWGVYSYIIPFVEVVVFEAALNLYDREFEDDPAYHSTWKSFSKNLRTTPVHDTDSFQINQLYHPYQGSMYFGFARSAGLSYWQSLLYSIGGSELWETAGETGPPSANDHFASGIGGSFLGEPLFRMAHLLLEGGGEKPGFWRELGATILSPPVGINRNLFGDRFDKVFPSHNPPTFMRLRLGASTAARQTDNGVVNTFAREQATLDFLMVYGLPGHAGYTYDRPFDYFSFEFAAGTGSGQGGFESILSRGMLYGRAYDVGAAYRGIWGLYGSYDYISPEVFRISSTALSLGTTAQWWLMEDVALQYSAMAGMGYAAAGTISGPGDRDYRYGVTPQGLLAMRLIISDRAMLDLTGREYYITDWTGTGAEGHEMIGRANIGITFRVYAQHAIGLQFVTITRDAQVVGAEDRHQTEEVISLVYTLLGDNNFGAVEW